MERQWKGKDYFQDLYEEEARKPCFHGMNEDKGFYTMINRLKVNHYNLNKSLGRKGYVDHMRVQSTKGRYESGDA